MHATWMETRGEVQLTPQGVGAIKISEDQSHIDGEGGEAHLTAQACSLTCTLGYSCTTWWNSSASRVNMSQLVSALAVKMDGNSSL